MHARIARYKFSGDAQELSRRAEEGLVPIFQSQSGFKAYTLVQSDDEVLSFSAWSSAQEADEASKTIASWVAENMADDIELEEVRVGEILLSTSLGVSAKAGARA